MLDVAIDGR
jgi:hypothetical protein